MHCVCLCCRVSAGTDAPCVCDCVAGCQLGLMHCVCLCCSVSAGTDAPCVCLCCRVSAGTDALCVPVLQGVSWD